ncbi:MAG: DUF4870 domain-containing protein, partial [Anaerolineae bacterium]
VPAPRPSIGPEDETTWAMGAHLSGLVAPVIGPLVVMAVNKHHSTFVEDHPREALNMHLWLLILAVAAVMFSIVTVGVGAICAGPLLVLAAIGYTVLTVMAAVQANDGHAYRYPFVVRLIK